MSGLKQHKEFILLVLLYLLAEILVDPLGNFPLNDDWAYAGALETLSSEGRVDIGVWPAMTLVTHLLWGLLFTKIFGFSFFVLRLSGIVSAIIGAAFMYRLLIQLKQDKKAAVLASAILVFNPLMFSVSNSYMTDVNFNTLFIIGIYYSFRLFQSQRLIYLFAALVSCLALVFLRQFGLMCMLALPFACLFMKNKRWLCLVLSLCGSITIFILLKYYESYLRRILPPDANYQFSDGAFFRDPDWLKHLWWNFYDRSRMIILHVFIYLAPLFLVVLLTLVKRFNSVFVLISAVSTLIFTFLVFHSPYFPSGNLFENMRLGPENLLQTWRSADHGKVQGFDEIMYAVKIICAFIALFSIFLLLMNYLKQNKPGEFFRSEFVFLFSLLFIYLFLMLMSAFYFDRYHIPLFTISILIVLNIFREENLKIWPSVIPLILLTYVSIAGTRDYIGFNGQKWKAINYLKEELKVSSGKINAGFEYEGWTHRHQNFDWSKFLEIKNFDYVVQFDPEKGFVPLIEFPFQRYFPPKKDKIYIFVRDSLAR